MVSEATHAERLDMLIDDPELYEEVVSEYSGERKCYYKLSDAVPNTAESFEEYIEFLEVLLKKGNNGLVSAIWNRDRLARSIKNMILEDSAAGEKYAVANLKETRRCIDEFNDIGLDAPSLSMVITTTIEHIYRNSAHRSNAYHIYNSLLEKTPDDRYESVELLARLRFAESVKSNQGFRDRLDWEERKYLQVTQDLAPDNEKNWEDLIETADKLKPENHKKMELYRHALHEGAPSKTFLKYLYLAGRDVVERARHIQRKDPSLGEIYAAEVQLNCASQAISYGFDIEKDEYVNSYLNISVALRNSGGKWASDADHRNFPDPDFEEASQRYSSAASSMKGCHNPRYIKYLSKAFRHSANAMEDPRVERLLQSQAINILEDLKETLEETEVIENSKSVHIFEKMLVEARSHMRKKEYGEALDCIDQAEEMIDSELPQEDAGGRELEMIRKTASARLIERGEDFDIAEQQFAELKMYNRAALSRSKNALLNSEYEKAIEEIEDNIGGKNILISAIKAASGDVQHNITESSADIFGIYEEDKLLLRRLIIIHRHLQTPEIEEAIREYIIEV